jgi:DNA-binding transcriptional MerR regulator
MPTDEEYFSISDACALSGLSPQTLKTYESQRVLGPIKRDSRGVRLYTMRDIEQARQINESRLARHGRTGLRRKFIVTSTSTTR